MKTKFKIGDVVEITTPVDHRINYKNLHGRTGVVKNITTYKDLNTYYLEIEGCYNKYHYRGWFLYQEEDLEVTQPIGFAVKYNDEKETDEMYIDKTNIVRLYFENENSKITKKYCEKEKRLAKKDPIISQIEAFKKQMKDVDNLKIEYEYEFPKDIQEKQQLLFVERDRERDVLRDKCREIEIILEDCETYDQRQNILKAYGIVDEQGKLIK